MTWPFLSRLETRSVARRLASSSRVLPPGMSAAFIDAELSIRITQSFPGTRRVVGNRAGQCQDQPQQQISNCRNSSRFFRSRWKGEFTCRSWMAFFQRNVEEIATSRRRSLRKYKSSSKGRAIAAAIAPARGDRKWGNQGICLNSKNPGIEVRQLHLPAHHGQQLSAINSELANGKCEPATTCYQLATSN